MWTLGDRAARPRLASPGDRTHPAGSGGVRAVTRLADLLGAVAMGVLLAVLVLGLALDGSLRDLDDRD